MYSDGMKQMIEALLKKDTRKRPSLNEVFKMPSMRERMKQYGYSLDEHEAKIQSQKMAGKRPEEQKGGGSQPPPAHKRGVSDG